MSDDASVLSKVQVKDRLEAGGGRLEAGENSRDHRHAPLHISRHACPVSNTGQIPGLVERSAGASIARQTILEVVGGSPRSKSIPIHHAGDGLGGLVLVRIPGVGHVAEGRHVDWVPMGTMSSAFAIVLATRSPRTQVRSSICGTVHRRLTEGDSTNFATCVSCRKVRLPRGL